MAKNKHNLYAGDHFKKKFKWGELHVSIGYIKKFKDDESPVESVTYDGIKLRKEI